MKLIANQLIFFFLTKLVFCNSSYELLQFPTDARSLALNSAASVYDGVLSGNNPASLSKLSEGITYSYFYIPANIYFTSIQKIKSYKNNIIVNKISLLNYGSIIDSETNDESYAFDVLIETGFKKEIKKTISIGITGGFFLSSISGYQSNILFSNMGIRSRLMKKRLGIGFSLENIGFILKSYTDINQPLPVLIRTALYYKLKYVPVIINSNIIQSINHNDTHLTAGLEFNTKNKITIRLGINSFRSGYLTNNLKSNILAGFSYGIGLDFTKIIIDIGCKNIGTAGYIIGFSLIKR